jgi:hypothetical protein
MLTLENDALVFRFPEVDERAICRVTFQRTLRVPDDGKTYPLPPGNARFALRHVDDYAALLPENIVKRGGVMLPMYESEAMWIRFESEYPFAVKVAAGKINAITGESWCDHLNDDPQDYLVVPDQPWIDGYFVGWDETRQFVAKPLGGGYTAEEQLTGEAEFGGLQIIVYPAKKQYADKCKIEQVPMRSFDEFICMNKNEMGLAPDGKISQDICEDRYHLGAWDQRHSSRCFVTLVNSKSWKAFTKENLPRAPLNAQDYEKAGLPWFSYYESDNFTISDSPVLEKLKAPKDVWKEKREKLYNPPGLPGLMVDPHPDAERELLREKEKLGENGSLTIGGKAILKRREVGK